MIVKICIPHTYRDYFDYHYEGEVPSVGSRVWVPFRKRVRLGIVIEHGEPEDSQRQLKSVHEVVDREPILSPEILALCQWVSRYYHSPLSEVIALALPKRYQRGMSSTCEALPPLKASISDKPLLLNHEQTMAVEAMTPYLNTYHCFLLQGVTGSGKTEVYLHMIMQVLAQNRQVLVLVPEIGLTPQLLDRFRARILVPMAVMHSQLSEKQRQTVWQLAQNHEIRLIIGTRSALFTPLPQLGLIIVDEEHDASLKQMDGVRYSARDAALMRAYQANVPIVLGSATPSLESLYNCQLHKYTPLYLRQRALSQAPLYYRVVDIRNQPLSHGLTNTALALIQEHLQQQNQVLVFINRRGFSPVLFCHQCGWIADCSGCDSHLTLHLSKQRLICHHCGLTQSVMKHCPECQGQELLPVGIGTQRVHEYLTEQFPTISLVRIDRDEVGSKHALNKKLAKIRAGEAQLIVGTQMLAKGHDFPRLTLVVILEADQGFYNQDFRALERLGQLLVQVAGRAGRAARPGEVVIQTHLPNHPLLNVLIQSGYETFARELLATREAAQLPPFYFLALIRGQAKSLPILSTFMHKIKALLNSADAQVLGPAPAPLARKAHYHRMQLLIKAPSRQKLKAILSLLNETVHLHKMDKGVRWDVDVDPVELA